MKRIIGVFLVVFTFAAPATAHMPSPHAPRPHHVERVHAPRPIRAVRGTPRPASKHPVRVHHHKNLARDVIVPVAITLAMVL